MPENAELAILADRLQKYVGSSINKIEWNQKSKFYKKPIKGIDQIKYPLKISSIWTRGKVLVFQCNHIYLVSQLGMSGNWIDNKEKHCDMWFDMNDKKLYFSDYRHFGNFGVYKDLSSVWKKHGPCLLSTALQKFDNKKLNKEQKTVSLEYYLEKINNPRIKNKKICVYLLEQRHVSGIGNYLRAEVMYKVKISPHRKLCELSLEDKKKLYRASLEVPYMAYKSRGPPKGYYPDGKFNLCVYECTTDPMGNKVVKEKINNRTIHWVPQIQK